MKKYITILMLSLFVFTSCKKESLQSYLVESQEKKEFMYADVPAGIIQLKDSGVSEADRKAYESIRKINVAGLLAKNAKHGQYEAEVAKLKSILKNSDYKKLMDVNMKGNHMTVYYSGKTDAIDEIVAFAYNKKAGVGVARLLGENMNPNAIMNMMKNSKLDSDNANLRQFKMILEKNADKKTISEERLVKVKDLKEKADKQ